LVIGKFKLFVLIFKNKTDSFKKVVFSGYSFIFKKEYNHLV